jgi:aminoglycoside phosphotransferase (APT) family kinase protein
MPEPTMTPEALERFLASVEPGRRAAVTAFRPITGGYSRLSAVADVGWDDGATQRVVLRGDPAPGDGVFVSDRDAEWRTLRALSRARAVPVARPRWYDATGEFFGTKCIVFDFFAGRSLQDVLRQAGDDSAPGRMFVDAVAQIHATPLDALGDAVERPGSWDDYVDGVLELYRAVDREVSESSPVLRYASALLVRHRPAPVPFTLVHGDCQPSNVLVAESGEHIVIDWEFAHIGDPREDLGYYSQIPMPPNVYHLDPQSFLARYREQTGLSEEQVNPDTVQYFLVIGMAHLLAQILRALDAVSRGETRGVMATYLISAVTHQYGLYLDICRRVAA